MWAGVTFTVVFLAIILLPGLALSQSTKQEWVIRSRLLFSVGFSYALFVLALGVFQFFQISWQYFSFLMTAVISISAITILYSQAHTINKKAVLNHIQANLVSLSIIGFVTAYHFFVGPYNEVPADIYAHLGYFQTAFEFQQQGTMGRDVGAAFFMQKGLAWYHLLAFCSKVSGADAETVVYVTTWVTKTLFLLGVYSFSLCMFSKIKYAKSIAILATGFLALHMGINVMAYVRYYSFAPTMLNLLLYFSAVAVFLRVLNTQRVLTLASQLFYILILILAAAAIHTQEVLFIVVMFALLALVKVVISPDKNGLLANTLGRYLPKVILFLALIGFSVIYIVAKNKFDRAPNVGWRLWEFGTISEWLPKITTLNLKYQFIRVITLWGILVYIAAIFYWREVRKNTFLVAGLISPLFTILNPFFIDLFLRLDNSTTLWRMSYLIPLHFVAAFVVVKVISGFRDGRFGVLQKALGVTYLTLSVLLLLPLKNTFAGIHYSRFPTLSAVSSQNNHEHLSDVLDVLGQIDGRHVILTDPITGYVISGLTHHHSYRHKFFRRGYLEFSFDDYSDFPLKRHQGRLILVNGRTKADSAVGTLSRHWSGQVLDVSGYYSPKLDAHLTSHPERFSLLWESEASDMRLYKIL